MSKSPMLDFLNGYETAKSDGGAHASVGKRFFVRSFSGSVTQKTRRFLNMGPMKLAKSITGRFAYASAKIYGALFLTFGLLSIIFHFIKEYTPMFGESSMWSLLMGILFSVFSIPLLLVDDPIAIMLQRYRVTDVIFFEFFSIKRMYYTGNEKALPVAVSIFFGAALAVVGLFVPAWWIAAFIGAALFVCTAFLSPEFAFFSSLLVLPYVSFFKYSTVVFSVIVLLAALSFMRKALFGKRVIFFEQYDFLSIVIMLAIMISGIFLGGLSSFTTAVFTSVMLLGYFLASNTLTNRRLTDCALHAVVISSVPVSIISIVDLIIAIVSGSVKSFLLSQYSATFASSETSAVFFIIATLFAITLSKDARGKMRFVYAVFAALSIISLAISGELFALLALLIGYVSYLILKSKSVFVLITPVLLLLPYGALLLPREILSYVPSHIINPDTLSLWRSCLSAFSENLFFGIGMGKESFAEKMAEYGIVGAKSSENMFIEAGLEAGIFSLLALLLMLLIRLRHRARYRLYVRSSDMQSIADVSSMIVASLFCFGAFSPLLSDHTAMYLFFTVFGMGSAALRSAKRQSDERVLYFEDETSSTSSVINVHIR